MSFFLYNSSKGGKKRSALTPAPKRPLDLTEKLASLDETNSRSNKAKSKLDVIRYGSGYAYGGSEGNMGSNDNEVSESNIATDVGLYGQCIERDAATTSTILRQRRFAKVPHAKITTATTKSVDEASSAGLSRFTTLTSRSGLGKRVTNGGRSKRKKQRSTHVICAVAENLANETCVASLDAGSPTTLHVTKQGNGQAYAETLAYLSVLQPDEILMNEGRRTSQLTRKILEQYGEFNDDAAGGFDLHKNAMTVTSVFPNHRHHGQAGRRRRRRRDMDSRYQSRQCDGNNESDYDDENHEGSGSMHKTTKDCKTIVKLISRSCFDQTRGAELLRKVSRQESYHGAILEDFILLSSSHAVLLYLQQCLGATLSKHSLRLHVQVGGNNRMVIDRSSLLHLELLNNTKSGKVADSLIGTIDYTKTSVGSRLLRTNIMSPPCQVDTIEARMELVDTFLEYEDFFYETMDHLQQLPDVDRMLANLALVPNSANDDDGGNVSANLASKGISALVCIKSTLSALPSFANVLQKQLEEVSGRENNDDNSVTTGIDSILVGMGMGGQRQERVGDQYYPSRQSNIEDDENIQQSVSHKCFLLRAIHFAFTQPALKDLHSAICSVFTESTRFSRNANVMRHQECFALKCEDDGFMSILRKAFLANVDDIYRKADEYAEVYGLKVSVRYTSSRGYFLAVPVSVSADLPAVFLQPTVSGRFILCTTEEVTSLNTRTEDNISNLLRMTHERVQEVMDIGRSHYDAVAALCDAVALLDMCHSFADKVTLSSDSWCKPVITDSFAKRKDLHIHDTTDGDTNHENDNEHRNAGAEATAGTLVIKQGRYGIERADISDTCGGVEGYVANDTFASLEKCYTVVSGVNGSGKSTYLKQIAIIVILAHCGSYVPAESATIPTRDMLCARIGTADDQEGNISSFMLEMKETSYICSNAGPQSLILIDELGRATSNEDGVAIAWSVSEYLLKRQSMTFFVTHYPQLCRIAEIYSRSAQNIHLKATITATSGDESMVSYTHKVESGPCTTCSNYGTKLAESCGWPTKIVTRSQQIEEEVRQSLPDERVCKPGTHTVETNRQTCNLLQSIERQLYQSRTEYDSKSCTSYAQLRSKFDVLRNKFLVESDDDVTNEVCEMLRLYIGKLNHLNSDSSEEAGEGGGAHRRYDERRHETSDGNSDGSIDYFAIDDDRQSWSD